MEAQAEVVLGVAGLGLLVGAWEGWGRAYREHDQRLDSMSE